MVTLMELAEAARVRLLGAEFDLVTPAQVLAAIQAVTARRGLAVVANHNAHSIYLCRRSPALRAFFEQAEVIEVDSTPVIAWGRLLGLPISGEHRSTYLDWREDFWRLADAEGWRVFYLGGAPGVAEAAIETLNRRWPHVRIAAQHGYIDTAPDSDDDRALLKTIAAFDPDVIFVGMGMPRQELWILDHRPLLLRGVLFSVGAAFDYEAGVQSPAPRWMGRMGVEWLYRLATQPRRLGFRYLVEPWFLAPAALADVRDRLMRRGSAGTAPLARARRAS